MLVLSRKKGESLLLGDDIKITILECSDDRVSIGIEAPKSVQIVRGELLEETIKANLEAVTSSFISLEDFKKKE
jgi:carbon storage regulator